MSSYSTEFTVYWGDLDHARVVYYPQFFHMFHRAMEDWFADAVGVRYPEVVKRVGFPTVHVETDFRSPLAYGDHVRIHVDVVKVGSKSLTLKYTAYRLPAGELSALAVITTVCIDENFKSTRIPDDLREKFDVCKAAQD